MQKTCNEENAHVSKTCGGADGADAAAAKAIRSALPPKFKDVSALAEAYNALQAEFTRRCQRLKELEMRAEESSGNAFAFGIKNLLFRAGQNSVKFEKFQLFDIYIVAPDRS